MFDIVELVSLKDELKTHAEILTKKCIAETNEEKKFSEKKSFSISSPRVVGIKDDNLYLFTWNCEDLCNEKTFVAVYKKYTSSSETIFTHQNSLFIVNATVNSSLSLLAYSCKERKGSSQELYNSYISEIYPQMRLFSLNVRWKKYQRVQFLNDSNHASSKVSNLLFFHHQESINLYRIPAFTGSDGSLMNSNSSVVPIASRFVWAQFDLKFKRLFYVELNPLDEGSTDSEGILNALEFDELGNFQTILKFSLPLSFKMEFMQSEVVYNDLLLTDLISCSNFNMRVLQSEAGSLYVCYQQTLKDDSNDTDHSVSSSSADNESISYAICCIHAGFKLQCSSHSVNGHYPHIFFTMFNDFVLVYAHQSFFHLLDISYEHEPVHNILISSESPFFPSLKTTSNILLSSIDSSIIFDISSQKLYKFEINTSKLLEMFCFSDAATRLSILHIVLVHLDNKKIRKGIINVLGEDCSNFETSGLLKEYLVAQNYVRMWKYIESKLDLKLFPFTTQEFYRGQIERNNTGERQSHLFYSFYSENQILQLKKELSKCKNQFWCSIYNNLCYESDKSRSKRFPFKLLFLAGVDLNDDLQNLSDGSISNHSFSEHDGVDEDAVDNEVKNNTTTQKMITYILANHRGLSKSKVENLCTAYTKERNIIISSLWKQLLRSFGNKTFQTLMNTSILKPLDENEVILFHILQRIKVVKDELCFPGFHGMKKLLCSLGFRYLTHRQFLAYMEACVIEINSHFVTQVLEELNDSQENIVIKLTLLKKLSQEEAKDFLKRWNNKSGNRHLLRQILSSLNYRVKQRPDNSDSYLIDECFAPLQSLIECLNWHKKDLVLDDKEETVELIRSISLAETEALVLKS